MLWFAERSAGRRRRFRPAPSLSRAATLGSRRSKSADGLRAGMDLVLDRGADMANVPGGASGLLVRDYKGKEADRLVTRIAPASSRWWPNCAATSGRPSNL
jgi:hypothetical protein